MNGLGMLLSKKWKDKLSNDPETGMGFQDVEVNTIEGKIIVGVVLNGEHLLIDPIIPEASIKDIIVKMRNKGE